MSAGTELRARIARLAETGPVVALPVTQAELELLRAACPCPAGMVRPRGAVSLSLLAGIDILVVDDPDAWIEARR